MPSARMPLRLNAGLSRKFADQARPDELSLREASQVINELKDDTKGST